MNGGDIRYLVPALLLILAAGCGGGSGGGNRLAEGGIGGTGISTGAVTARGSIIVNGRRFTLAGAAITVNGSPAGASALRIGRVVTVNGDLGDGIAERVAFVPRLVGPVDGVHGGAALDCAADAGALTAVQQPVETGPSTIVDCGSAATIAPGDRVLVSGYRREDGTLVASYVERLAGGDFPSDQVIGRVTAAAAGGFTIGNLAVAAREDPAPGTRVLVRGVYDTTTGVLTADRVAEQPPVSVAGGEEAEVEGIIDEFTDASEFRVNGIPVDARAAAIEDPLGGDAENRLGIDAGVEVEGRFDGSGRLVAERIEIEIEENVEISADASGVDTAARSVSFFGGALVVEVTDRTRLKDDTDADVADFGLDDIRSGDRLDLEGFTVGGAVAAARIDREEADDEVTIEAPVQDKDETAATITVLGLPPIDVSGAEGDALSDIAIGDIVEIGWEAFTGLDQPADDLEKETD